MAVVPKIFGTPIIGYQTNAFGGVDADVTTIVPLAIVDFVAGGAGEDCIKAHGISLKVKVNSSGTTDNFEVILEASEDGSDWDTTGNELTVFTVTATSGNDSTRTVIVPAPARHLRIQGRRSGSTDTFDVEVTITPYTYGE